MRDYLFRGKVTDDYYIKEMRGTWVEGNLVHQTEYYGMSVDKYHILYTGEFHVDYYDAATVIPETVGQWTGLLDKNGKRIFEDDIIRDEWGRTKVVQFLNGYYYPFIAFPEFNCWSEDECEVVGNVTDNSDLLQLQRLED